MSHSTRGDIIIFVEKVSETEMKMQFLAYSILFWWSNLDFIGDLVLDFIGVSLDFILMERSAWLVKMRRQCKSTKKWIILYEPLLRNPKIKTKRFNQVWRKGKIWCGFDAWTSYFYSVHFYQISQFYNIPPLYLSKSVVGMLKIFASLKSLF